ncbi:MAG: hypothetical protein ACXABD_04735 [Candidatus Thorarchaeota archaeon]|jgi:hypothetical protein
MALNSYTRLNKHVTQIGETLLTSQLESNLKTYLDWGLLEVGSFFNVSPPDSGAYGGTYDRLRLVDDPSYTLGQVWEAARKDWVWETGLSYSSQPTQITGVIVNGTSYGTGDATYGHYYNYPLGRVIFNNAQLDTSVVQLEYSYRNVQTYIADQAPWWDEIQYDSFRVDDPTLMDVGSGNWQILSNHRVQLPAVVVEAVPRRRFRPYEQGNVSSYVYQDVLFHILAESRWWRNQLIDIISLEKDRTIWMYDNNLVSSGDLYPLDYRGMVVSNPIMYPDLVNSYRFKRARFYDMVVTEMESSSRLHRGTVRATFEIVMA